MTTQADFLTIPDTAGDFGSESSYGETRDERASDSGFMPGPPLRGQLSDSAPSSQFRGNFFPDRASTPENHSLKDNRKIVTTILGYLNDQKDRLAALRVCRKWSSWAAEVLWYRPDLPRYGTVEKMIRTLESPNLTFPYSKFIRRLSFIGAPAPWVENSTLTTLSRCDLLERLNLHGARQLNAPVLEATLTSWPNLISIDLTGVTQVTDEAIISLAGVSTKLRGVNLNGCQIPGDPALIALAENCQNLSRLRMGASNSITDVGISAIVQACPQLLELDIRHCKNITDIAVREVWTHSYRNMRELHLGYCTSLTDLAFPAKVSIGEVEDSPQGQKDQNAGLLGQGEHDAAKGLKVADAEDRSVEADPVQVVPEVRELAITDPQEHVSLLPGLSSVELWRRTVPQTLASLRILDLSSCAQITDIAVEQIVSSAPRLRNFVLSKCPLLTDRSVEAICELGPSLHFLNMAHVDQVTDEAVKKLAQSCTKLRYIDFAGCYKLTDDSIVELSKLPKLRRVGLVRVPKITDVAIYALAARTTILERAHLSYCKEITLKAIHFLLDKVPKLNHLSLTGIPAFLVPELQRFCREPPKEWNTQQRSAFCVYSGQGIEQLRKHLDATLGEAFDEQNLVNTIGDAPPVGDVGSDSDSDYEAEAL